MQFVRNGKNLGAYRRLLTSLAAQSAFCDQRFAITAIVALAFIVSVSLSDATENTSASTKVNCFPAFSTFARHTSLSPCAGLRMLILNSTVRTVFPIGAIL